jgi:hypothetical protein
MVACINIDVNNLVKDSSSSENDEDCGSDYCSSGRRKDNGFPEHCPQDYYYYSHQHLHYYSHKKDD